ncbi:response regulator [Haloglomus litoreum]|uniref:response regulator n=1 Tax=Haloglomus litoreum TaxID=3034026 RepID=UPI0023E8BCA6|nr:response regulator [Haloglomus sp. DT116]
MATTLSGNLTVLHAEDDRAFADLTGDMLESVADDIEVVTAHDPEGALERLAEEPVDCIVSDYDMPGMDGLELLEAVRADHPDLPFILFTGKGSEEIASQAISAGVTDYLQKGGGQDCYEMLANRVRTAVDRYRSEERYHNLVDTAPVPIALFSPDRRLRYANDATVDFLEAESAEALLGTPMPAFVHPDDHERALERFGSIMTEDRPAPEMEFRIRAVDGTVKRAVLATAPGHYRGEQVAQVVVRLVEE